MRTRTIAAGTGLIAAGVVAGLMVGAAMAQPAPETGPDAGAPPGPGGRAAWMMEHGGPHGWFRQGHEGGPHAMFERLRTFSLVYTAEDRKLSPADVQKIAEGFLLWHGNHDWKVVDVSQAPDNKVAFALATKEGSVIAHFTMDQKTGRVARTG